MVQQSRPSPQSSGPTGGFSGKRARSGQGNGSKAAAIPPPSPSRGLAPHGARERRSYAAIDLGTNNCRLLIAKPSADGFIVVDAFSRIVRLGEGLASTGRISDAAIDRAIAALSVCADKLRRRHVALAR
ncbi:MAG: Ppx/GppA family phosphatase, partial [Alphaproteobacteria bacterium]